MGYFALVNDDNIVEIVIAVSNSDLGEPLLTFPETESAGKAFIANKLRLEGIWLQTSYNANFRGKYAGIGDRYDPELDEFVSPHAELSN